MSEERRPADPEVRPPSRAATAGLWLVAAMVALVVLWLAF